MQRILELRNRYILLLDAALLMIIPALALSIRLDGFSWWPESFQAVALFTVVTMAIKLVYFRLFYLYNRYWRYASVEDLFYVVVAVMVSTFVIGALLLFANPFLRTYDLNLPRSLPLIDGMLTFLAVGGLRFGMRGLHHWYRERSGRSDGRRVMIVGAGEAGVLVVRQIRADRELNMEPVLFVDDDPSNDNRRIQGVPVLGTCKDIGPLVRQYKIQSIIVAIPSASLERRREIESLCNETGVATHSLPGINALLTGYKGIFRSGEIDVSKLLHRAPLEFDLEEVAEAYAGETILVTGAGGSIGGELCRQLARIKPKEIILLGHGENSIFNIGLNLRLKFPDLVTHHVIVDVKNEQRLNWVIEKYRPKVIFHAAAYKHVPFMEMNIEGAVLNNVLGTWNVLKAVKKYNVERFVLISTDKAVKPTSIMGATKRIAELLNIAASRESGQSFMAVRFGNVLGSRGSVIPIFQQQIANGGPLTITHPQMKRFFMTIPEAVNLVLHSSLMGKKGEIFVLDMGEQVTIKDLAIDFIRLSGMRPFEDIDIVYSGIRPGEKLEEELFSWNENNEETRYSKISKATADEKLDISLLKSEVNELIRLTKTMDTQAALRQIKRILPDFNSKQQNEPAELLRHLTRPN